MKKIFFIIFCIILILIIIGCEKKSSNNKNQIMSAKKNSFQGKKVLFIDSYHESYEPNIKSRNAMEKILKNTGIVFIYRFLDEKNTVNQSILKERGLSIFNEIENIKPDIIVLADDPAMKFVSEPYLMSLGIPLVFIGVNWKYPKYPEVPLTGQIEVELLKELVNDLKQYSKGSKVGILTANSDTDEKSISIYENELGISFSEKVFVNNFDNWKKEFIRMQNTVDLLILRQNAGINGWDDVEAEKFIHTETRIPTGSPNLHMSPFSLLCYPKDNAEFGEYAANTIALILSGVKPQSLPYEKNFRSNFTVNAIIAKKLGITFSADFLESANIITSQTKRIAYINSYHKGNEWGDSIEKGFLKSLDIQYSDNRDKYDKQGLNLRFFYLDGKRSSADEISKHAVELKKELDKWVPDIIVTSDDEAIKYLIVPYFMNKNIPVLFCGLNWDASIYNLSTKNITGMIEVAPVKELVDFLFTISKGKKIGYIGADVLSESKEINYYKEIFGISFNDGVLVKSVEEWKLNFIRMQKTCDQIILLSNSGIPDWNDSEIEKFILDETRIPTGTTTKNSNKFSLISFSRIPEEQGWWVGEKVKDIISGKSISEIEIAHNVKFTTYVNPILMKKLSVKIPATMLDSAFYIETKSQK